MAQVIEIPPENTSTKRVGGIDSPFSNDAAMLSSASQFTPTPMAHFVEVVMPDWRGPSFNDLARTDPKRLLKLISGNRLAFHDLTFAAEAAGKIAQADDEVVHVLLPLLEHRSPLVREGAIYGLSPFATSRQWVMMRLECIAAKDPSPGVREAAREALYE
ncbi:MAG: HEAT repeat domain-containing protein [Kofleriaceae bacterium]